jgi:hypothetical protein
MATAAWQQARPSAKRPGAFASRLRGGLKDFGRRVTYDIAGLPIAVRATFNRRSLTSEAIIRRAYARRFWRPKTVADASALMLALMLWPVALIGLEAMFTFRNGGVAARCSNRPIVHQLLDQTRLYFAAGVLPPWYYIFELHRRPPNSHARNFIYRWESKGGVLGLLRERHAPTSVLNDKEQFGDHCRRHQIACAPVLAVARNGKLGLRAHPAELGTDLFVKPVQGRGGKGAERWDHVAGRYRDTHGLELTREQLFERLMRASVVQPLLIQRLLHNHPALDSLNNGALSTVRVLTCLDERGVPELVGAAMRMAIGDNCVVDNLHAGGIATAVDMETGALGMASNLGADSSLGWVDRHPDSDAPITGTTLPMWKEVRDFAIRAHKAFGDRLLVGWDIAITSDGPVLIEGNGSPDLDIMQRFVRHGLMAGRLGVLLAFHVSRLGLDHLQLVRSSGGGVDPELAELSVQGRTADPEPARDLGHTAAIMADREADDIRFDLFERPQMPIAGEQGHGW